MKAQEALHEISTMVFRNTDNFEMRISKDCYKNIINALEKQIPKKVHFHHSREKGICPNCLSVEDTSANYCRCCGQLLDFDTDHPTEKGGEQE